MRHSVARRLQLTAVLAAVLVAGCTAPVGDDLVGRPTESELTESAVPATSGSPADVAETYRVGTWDVTVLSTDRDAGNDLGQGNHPADFPQVRTTLHVTNVAETVQDILELEFAFGDVNGTQNGYSPWDDWCAPDPQSYLTLPTLFLPGESRIVTVCVPVDPSDAAGLSMWLIPGDPAVTDIEVEVPLLPEGATVDPPASVDTATVHRRLLEQVPTAGIAFGYEFSVESVAIGQPQGELVTVMVTVRAEPINPETTRSQWVEVAMIGESGGAVDAESCEQGAYWPALVGEPWTHEFCADVPAADAPALLVVLRQGYVEPASLALDARIP